ncbi:MAG: carbohydrate ABC transporter permease [Chloroflexi bacterium]|nr:carbohydrate ABC transporter permease [Chloroflexota bacterium]
MADQTASLPRTVDVRAGSTSAARTRSRLVFYAVAIVLTLFFVGPFYWTVASSLKTPAEIATFPPVFVPAQLRFDNYARAWTKVPFLDFYTNSLIVTVLAVSGQVLSACMVAYGFARFQFPFRNTLFMLVIATLIVPWEVTIIPSFLLYKWLGWLDTLKPLIVPSWFGGSPLYIFLLRQFFMSIPRDLDEAAEMDGANSFRILWQILVPLCAPALTTVAIFSFLQHWNEFIQPLIFLNSETNFTVSLGLRLFQTAPADPGEPKEHLLMAAAVIASAPCIALFFAAQRFFVRGIVMSGIKG